MDARLRDVERAFMTSGAPEAEARYLRELVRQGELALERLELAAFLGHVPSAQALEDCPRPALGAGELAKVLDRSRQRVEIWTQQGCPNRVEDGQVVYRLGDVSDWLLRRESVKPDTALEVAALYHWHAEAPARILLGMLAWLLEDWVGLDPTAGGLSATHETVLAWLRQGAPDDAEAQVMSLIEAASPSEVRPELIGLVSILLRGIGYARDDVGLYRIYCETALDGPWKHLLADVADPFGTPVESQRAAYLETWRAAGARTIPWALERD